MSERWCTDWTAVYGSLTAGDSALQAVSTSCRMPNPEILLKGSLEAEVDGGRHDAGDVLAGGERARRVGRPEMGHRRPRHDVVAQPRHERDGDALLLHVPQEMAGSQGLQVAGPECRDRHGMVRPDRSRLFGALAGAGDRPQRPVRRDREDRVDLERVGQMVGERDDRRDADEEQQHGATHRQPGEPVDPTARAEPDGVEPGRRIREGADEHREDPLGHAVAQEVADQPRRELRRGELQRDHRQAEHRGDDTDHGGRDHGQQGARVVGRPLEDDPAERPRVTDVDRRQDPADDQRHQPGHRRQHPERAPAVLEEFAPPAPHGAPKPRVGPGRGRDGALRTRTRQVSSAAPTRSRAAARPAGTPG